MLQLLQSNPAAFAILAVALILALSFHEAAHAFIAKKLGDDTAETMGRLTLNPLAHLDPIGSLAILLIGIGWAKPVPVNPNNFNNPVLDNLKVALAGPASNLLLALIFAGLTHLFQPAPGSLAHTLSQTIIWFNLALMIFNLIPIPPLDGSKILAMFISHEAYYKLEQYGFFFLFALIALSWMNIDILSTIVFTPTSWLFALLTGQSGLNF